MKAIYINLDPYIAAFAAWLKGGKSGPAPSFQPLPLAVTVSLGQDVAVYLERNFEGVVDGADDFSADQLTVDGQSFGVDARLSDETAPSIAHDLVLGFSQVAPSAKYSVLAISDSVSVVVKFYDDDNEDYPIIFPVLVRRETASGPVDLVDFTPPASAIAAGTDLKGATFDGNEIVAAAGTGALSAPAGA
jgi:hypothetical protein